MCFFFGISESSLAIFLYGNLKSGHSEILQMFHFTLNYLFTLYKIIGIHLVLISTPLRQQDHKRPLLLLTQLDCWVTGL